jgi:hypothetical protein
MPFVATATAIAQSFTNGNVKFAISLPELPIVSGIAGVGSEADRVVLAKIPWALRSPVSLDRRGL